MYSADMTASWEYCHPIFDSPWSRLPGEDYITVEPSHLPESIPPCYRTSIPRSFSSLPHLPQTFPFRTSCSSQSPISQPLLFSLSQPHLPPAQARQSTRYPSSPVYAVLHASFHSQTNSTQFENTPNAIPVVALVPVGIKYDILFNGFVLASNGVNGNPLAGIIPQSPPNDIGYGGLNLPTITQGQPAMTVVYPDTTVQYFDLKSFYFG